MACKLRRRIIDLDDSRCQNDISRENCRCVDATFRLGWHAHEEPDLLGRCVRSGREVCDLAVEVSGVFASSSSRK